MKITLKNILSDALRVRKILKIDEAFDIGAQYFFKQSTVERTFRHRGKSTIPCIKLNSKMKPLKKGDTISFYKWIGETKFKSDYEQKSIRTRVRTSKNKLAEKPKDKREIVRDGEDGLDRRATTKTKGKNDTNKS